jgi:hypothetical protein
MAKPKMLESDAREQLIAELTAQVFKPARHADANVSGPQDAVP